MRNLQASETRLPLSLSRSPDVWHSGRVLVVDANHTIVCALPEKDEALARMMVERVNNAATA